MQELARSIVVRAKRDRVFGEICDIEARSRDLPAFQRVEIRDRTDDGFVATMYEHYGGRDVVVTSQFRFQRPDWVTYQHVESPYGENSGTFSLAEVDGGTRIDHVHRTEQDISEGTTLRQEWIELMDQQLDAIRQAAERDQGD
jgi:ribosome-associated toxin RatA of RatAB toxin-antitoxin module